MNLRAPDMVGNESGTMSWEKIGVWKSEAPDKIDIKVGDGIHKNHVGRRDALFTVIVRVRVVECCIQIHGVDEVYTIFRLMLCIGE
jgi:hypothetical protein